MQNVDSLAHPCVKDEGIAAIVDGKVGGAGNIENCESAALQPRMVLRRQRLPYHIRSGPLWQGRQLNIDKVAHTAE